MVNTVDSAMKSAKSNISQKKGEHAIPAYKK